MSATELPAKANRRQLHKTLLRMRLEMHRQELRHETLMMLQPLHQARDIGSHLRGELRNSNAPLWITVGALLLATLGVRNDNWRRWLRIALIAFPLLRRRPSRTPNDRPDEPGPKPPSGHDLA
ncbi:hypothetical protein [Pseudomonas zhanjiangensis]|uniref:YqjK-like protein n=1 Tax=Pseudomonas zhanjiangensis TaxID=3239015 RepID=A0ABV3YT61_9PSED